jgi:alginate O-acetyltransferase complex protein AlgI
MPFNSFTFFGFFLCVLLIHSLPLPPTARKLNLLFASYVFYAAWDVRFTLLLLFATVTNYVAARVIAKWDQFPDRRRLVLWVNVMLSIGLLCVFKYGNEFLGAWRWLAGHLSLSHEASTLSILLPVGLSFFTFQALSYTIDVYRRTIKPATSVLDLAMFVSFFPVLLAGPLLRAGPFLSQATQPRRATGAELGAGAAFITLGLFMKVALADHLLSPIVRQVFDPSASPDALTAWIGTVGFAAQDYCDFAGYSTCAVGLGMCLGLTLPDNFRAPFASVGFRDLWQRWHITLVAWLRDYVFNSLGGVYKGYRRAAINVLIVFFLIGLWHGAAWTYLIFGLLQGCYLIGEVILQRSAIRRLQLWNSPFGTFLMWLATMFLCMLAFVFYRTPELQQSWQILLTMFGARHVSFPIQLADYEILVVVLVVESLVVAHWLRRNVSLEELLLRVPWWVTAICLALMLFAITICSGESESYLYFHY